MLLQILIASVIGSVFALIGGIVLLWQEQLAKKFSLVLVSFAAGSLIGAAFLELLPEAIGEGPYKPVGLAVIVGILTLFLFEKVLRWYHCHDQDVCDYHSFSGTVLFGDAIHNFIDGIIIALSFSAGTSIGIAATAAIFFHEVPQEIGDFGVLLHAGYTKSKVFLYNFLTALTTPLGALVGYALLPWMSRSVGVFLAFAAGAFIYIAVSDLLPELKHKGKGAGAEIGHVASIILGIFLIWLVGTVFPE